MTVLAPLVKRIEVACDGDRAFAVFTAGIDGWWPVTGHSLGDEKVERIVLEPHLGGRIFERWHDGTECTWGEIKVWDPPHRLAFSWLPDPESGRSTEVEVSFEAEGEKTLVTLEHRGWQSDDVEATRRTSYDRGWEGVLDLFGRAV